MHCNAHSCHSAPCAEAPNNSRPPNCMRYKQCQAACICSYRIQTMTVASISKEKRNSKQRSSRPPASHSETASVSQGGVAFPVEGGLDDRAVPVLRGMELARRPMRRQRGCALPGVLPVCRELCGVAGVLLQRPVLGWVARCPAAINLQGRAQDAPLLPALFPAVGSVCLRAQALTARLSA